MDKILETIKRVGSLGWFIFTSILGILFFICVIIMWLGFFGFIEPKPVDLERPCIPNYMGGCDFF